MARKALPPELWGRIDEKCVFAPLTREDVASIARLLVQESSRNLAAERQITYELDDSVIDHLIEQGGFDPAHGARPMRRAIQRICETAVAEAILKGLAQTADVLRLTMKRGKVKVEVVD